MNEREKIVELVEKEDNYNLNDLKDIAAILRSDIGCPWDRKQTLESMKKCLADETQEVFEAIDNKDMDNLCEELGDVLLQVVMNSQLASEDDKFTLEDVINGVSKKLIRRHPHVFGDEEPAKTEEEALDRWKAMKEKERK